MKNRMGTAPQLENLGTDFIGRNIIYSPSMLSTMDTAKQAVRAGAIEGTLIITDEQTTGRGRRRRHWLSPPGNIALSIILYPSLFQLPKLIMVGSLAVVHAISQITPLKPTIKWPNDILINGRKVSGVLVESELERDNVNFAIVGIGVNINLPLTSFHNSPVRATSLSVELKRKIPQLEILQPLLYEFEHLYLAVRDGKSLRSRWLTYLETIGKRVQIKTNETTEGGDAESVDDDGHLLLRRSDGSLTSIATGDIAGFTEL